MYLRLWKDQYLCMYFVILLAKKKDTVCLAVATAASVKDAQSSMHDKIQVCWKKSSKAAQLKEQEQYYPLLRDHLAAFKQLPIEN